MRAIWSSSLAFAVLATACGGEAAYMEVAPVETMAMEPAPRMGATAPEMPLQEASPLNRDRMIIRNVDLELSVPDPTAAAEAAVSVVAGYGGHLDNSSAWRDGNRMHHELNLRVPVGRLDAAIAELKSMEGRVEREQVSSEDVTERAVDMDARLRNLQLTEQELQALLTESRQRNQEVEGIMAIYRELTQIRGQIDSLDGQLKSLSGLAALSTIRLTLRPDAAGRAIAEDPWQPSVVIRDSLGILLQVLQGLVNLALFSLIVLLPTALVLYAVVGLPWRAWRRRRRAAKAPS